MPKNLSQPLAFWLAAGLAFFAVHTNALPAPQGLQACSRQLRVDLLWQTAVDPYVTYEVRRARGAAGPFEMLSVPFTNVGVNAFSDFTGPAGPDFFYQVRSVRRQAEGHPPERSEWSEVCHARGAALDDKQLLTEVEEAGFRYFYYFVDPGSALPRVGTRLTPNVCSSGGAGWAMFNLVAAVQRGFLTRSQAAARAVQITGFLSDKAQRFHGAFPHWMDGKTGQALPFSKNDNGADIVETAFLMEGALFWREYFTGDNAAEREIRQRLDSLWRAVEWTWFVREEGGVHFLAWHWSPDHSWLPNDRISGFNECQIVYILGLASPTHPIPAECYWQGWEEPGYGNPRTQFGVPLELAGNYGPPLFWTEYSYLGFDPRQISYQGKTYFELFQNFCRVAELYAQSRQNQFKGYGDLWGWTAGYGPHGYTVYAPGQNDDGTINPSAALSAMPYAPEAGQKFLRELYVKHGRELWGPFGFYDTFNLTTGWASRDYLDDDVGPIGPMIENYRTGLGWQTFMKAPEIGPVLKTLAKGRESH